VPSASTHARASTTHAHSTIGAFGLALVSSATDCEDHGPATPSHRFNRYPVIATPRFLFPHGATRPRSASHVAITALILLRQTERQDQHGS